MVPLINAERQKVNLKMTSQQQAIKELWKIKATGKDSVLELRAIKGDEIISKLFKGPSYQSNQVLKLTFEKEALRLNAAGYNIYFVMNPIRDDFLTGSAKDKDIAYRDLLLIDIDKFGRKGESSTDAELEAARLLSVQITE